MTSLDELFPDSRRRTEADDGARRDVDVGLTALVGRPSSKDRAPAKTDVPALVAMVESARASASPVSAAPSGPKSVRRRATHRDVLSISTAVIAGAAVVTAGALSAVEMASASPAGEALRGLKADEATIVNIELTLQAQKTSLDERLVQARDEAAALSSALIEVRTVPDPRGVVLEGEPAPVVPVLDGEKLDAVLEDISAYDAALDAFEVPDLPVSYERGSVDPDSLSDVADAIDAAQFHLDELEVAGDAMSDAREQLDNVVAGQEKKLAAFAKTFTAAADRAVTENPEADQSLRDAMAEAGRSVAESRLLGEEAITSVTHYGDAFEELIFDQVRAQREREAIEAEERERERERQRREQQNQNPGGPDDGADGDVDGGGDEAPGDGTDGTDGGTDGGVDGTDGGSDGTEGGIDGIEGGGIF